MSSYSEKHTSTPDCAYKPCAEPATKLALVNGQPFWMCHSHHQQSQRDVAS